MLTILGRGHRLCDRVSRRGFLQIGGLALAGSALPDMLRAEAEAGTATPGKGVIMIFLVGGAPHIDMFDPKPEAPAEIRGQYQSIDTRVPGVRICEHLPRLASVMDKVALVRSLEGGTEAHEAHVCLTGFPSKANAGEDWPSFGSMVSALQGPAKPGVPPFVSLTPEMVHAPWALAGPTGFLGPVHAPFQPRRRGRDDSLLENMTLKNISLERISDRRALLASFDRFRREIDARGVMEGLDAYHRQAFEVLTSAKLVEAFDLDREDPRVRTKYGVGSPENVGNGGPRSMEQLLLARRLIEAGVRCVSLAFGHWDWHSEQYKYLKDDLPPFDRGFSALIEDLHQRGLDRDVSVVAWGEMGRTPRINKNAGRDHWPKVSAALLAGGGMRVGQVIGATDRLGEAAIDRPVHYQNVLSTLYRQWGINPKTTTVVGQRFGRSASMPLLEKHEPVTDLL